MLKNWKIIFISSAWLLSIVAGSIYLFRYSGTPGENIANTQMNWPLQSKIPRLHHQPTLLIFAHPYCPCSNASVGELERLMPHLKGRAQVVVIFVHPKSQPLSWVEGPLWEKTQKIPGVLVMSDYDYRETDLFAAKTSGQVLFFDPDDSIIFSGGITQARGHMGDSLGRELILNWLSGKPVKREVASVFGCALKDIKAERQ